MSQLEVWIRNQPGFKAIRHPARDWIVLVSEDDREATIGCCWPDEPCVRHRLADSVRTEKFKQGIREFLNVPH